MEMLKRLDTDFFLLLNGIHHPCMDAVMVFISGKITWLPLYLLVLLLLIKKFGWKAVYFVLAVFAVIALTDLVSVHFFKNVFMRLRPCHEPALAELVHTVNGKCGGSYGFISSHAANTFGFATYFLMVFRKKMTWLGPLLMVWAAIVSYSRIYLGVHYPGDILCGAVLGILVGLLVWWVQKLISRRFPL